MLKTGIDNWWLWVFLLVISIVFKYVFLSNMLFIQRTSLFNELTFHLEWILKAWLIILFPIKCSHYIRHSLPQSNSMTWSIWKMHDIFCIRQFLLLSNSLFGCLFWFECSMSRKCGNLLYFVIGHKSVKRHNRLLIRSKLTNWIFVYVIFLFVCNHIHTGFKKK